jgi:hypothetical protein
MGLPFAHIQNVAAVEGAWPVMGFSSHQQMHAGPSDRVAGNVAGCSHFSRQHHGNRPARPHRRHTRRSRRSRSSEAGQREHVVWQGPSQLEVGLSSWVLVTISPRHAKLGGEPRGMARPAGTPPPVLVSGAPPAGPWKELVWQFAPPPAASGGYESRCGF